MLCKKMIDSGGGRFTVKSDLGTGWDLNLTGTGRKVRYSNTLNVLDLFRSMS